MCISIQSVFNSFESKTSFGEGLMKRLVRIFFFLNLLMILLILSLFFLKSKPPSVVISFLFSGTIHI